MSPGKHGDGKARLGETKPSPPDPPAFHEQYKLGWDAAILAVRRWHEGKAKQAQVTARRNRFPKRFEQEAEFHEQAAEGLATLSPDDV